MASATDSLQAQLRALRKEVTQEKETELPIPGWDGTLVAKYGAMGWRDIRDMATSLEQSESKELDEAADLLLSCNLGVEARVNGHTQDLGKLGPGLAGFLGLAEDLPPDLPLTDRGALFLIFQNGCAEKEARIRIMRHLNDLGAQMGIVEDEADEEVSKN